MPTAKIAELLVPNVTIWLDAHGALPAAHVSITPLKMAVMDLTNTHALTVLLTDTVTHVPTKVASGAPLANVATQTTMATA